MSNKERWDPLDGYLAQPRGKRATLKRVAGALAGFIVTLVLGTAIILITLHFGMD